MKILIFAVNSVDKISLKYIFSFDMNIQCFEADTIDEVKNLSADHSFEIVYANCNLCEFDNFVNLREIRQICNHSFIYALTKDITSKTIRKLLSSGADNITETPIKTILTKTRFYAYKNLIESNQIINKESTSINLFDEEVFSSSTTLKIANEYELYQFVENYLLNYVKDESCLENIEKLGIYLIGLKKDFLIIIEESLAFKYFTFYVPSIAYIPFENFIDCKTLNYKNSKFKTSFKFELLKPTEKIELCDIKHKSTANDTAETAIHNHERLVVFDFIDNEDLAELIDFISELESMLSMLIYSDLKATEVVQVSKYLFEISKILSIYPQTYEISQAVNDLGETIAENIDVFIQKSRGMATVVIAMCNNLIAWEKALFIDGAPDEHYMADSIIADMKTIQNIITPAASSSEDMCDIFDF